VNVATPLLVSLALLVLNAFFVAAEFALVASKRHRLEELAATGSRAAKAAVRGSRELSLMLAGAQLGITLCTLGLGALAKPAVASLLEPVFLGVGVPDSAAYVVAVLIAVAVVVFLHMVVGEMAPKSWAISHPESSAVLLALPFRAFAWVARPALTVLNALANGCLRLVKVVPQDMLAAAHGPDDLRLLLAQSREHGTLPEADHQMLSGVLYLQRTTLSSALRPIDGVVAIDVDAGAEQVEQTSAVTGRSRLVVLDAGQPIGIVHVRDALKRAPREEHLTVRDLMTQGLQLPDDTVLLDAVGRLRAQRAQLALVTGADGTVVGLTALEDLLEKVLGEFEDETDGHTPVAAS